MSAPVVSRKAIRLRMGLFLAVLVIPVVGLLADDPAGGSSWDGTGLEESVLRFKVEVEGSRESVGLARLKNGGTIFLVKRSGAEGERALTPQQFADLLQSRRASSGWLATLLNISSPVGIAWVLLGLGGQLLFTGRMLVQWISSEKHRRSVVPVSFWWMSLIGATMLLAYFIWRRDIVGVLGQATGWLIYIRNLILIRKSRAP